MSAITAFTRKDAKAFLDTLAHGAKANKKHFLVPEGRKAMGVVAPSGFTPIVECYYRTKTMFYMAGVFYSRKELENLLVSTYSY